MIRPSVGCVLGITLTMMSAGCALVSRGQPLVVTYYDPQPALTRTDMPQSSGCLLAFGRVDAAGDLPEKIEYRTSPTQARYYAARRWTESPDRYLRRALERSLFETHRCERTLSVSAPTLDASLVSLYELRVPEEAHVAVHVLLHQRDMVLWDATVEATQSVTPDTSAFEAVVRAMSEALGDVIERIARGVEQSLQSNRHE